MQRSASIVLLLMLVLAPCPELKGADFLVRDFGAVGDGKTLSTASIQAAIDVCAHAGGGRVVLDKGVFLSGTLVMKDHVELHIKGKATLLGSTDPSHYPELSTPYRFFGDDWVKQSLIFGDRLVDIALTGKGVIDGQGAAFQVNTKKKPDRYRNRPYLIRFTACKDVVVEDLNLQNSAMWMQHYLACDNVVISGITVYNHCNKNNDMIDIDGCRNVVIENCKGDTDDDALTLKSTSPRACENVLIRNCIISSHCNAIKMGTESVGGFKNITIRDCEIRPSARKDVIYGLPEGISGISLEVVDGGVMENVFISGVRMDGPEVPLFIRLGNRARPYMEGLAPPPVGKLKDIRIENLRVRNAGKTGCSISGIAGHPAKNISLQDFKMDFRGGVKRSEVKEEVPELEDLYPEATMFGILPASVFYLRHLEGMKISDIQVSFLEKDERGLMELEDVKDLEQEEIKIVAKKTNSTKKI